MPTKTAKELEELFGVTSEELDQWEKMASAGELPGVPVGDIIVGRPKLFGEDLKPVAFKETQGKIEAMDARAHSMDMTRSQYLRWLVDRDLAFAAS